MADFKDLFSRQSKDYARFRPKYPDPLFAYLQAISPGHDLAWDCGTGNGQAALRLAEGFAQVVATDPSEKQLSSAPSHPRIEYRVAAAEKAPLPDHAVDLITVAQAFHWFRQEEFFAEARRVLRPQGILALWSYALCEITPEVEAVVNHLYRDILGPYWEKERKLVEEGYGGVRLPFEEISTPAFEMSAEWSLEHLVGYLSTWSALQTYRQREGKNPLEELFPSLQRAWGEVGLRPVRWPLSLRVGRLSI